MNSNILLLPILLPLMTGVASLALHKRPKLQEGLFVLGMGLTLVSAILLLVGLRDTGYLAINVGGWKAPIGIALVADWLAGLMVAVSAVLGLAVGVYALKEVPEWTRRAHFFTLYPLLLMGVNGAFLTGDLFNLYVWFEVMLIASFVLLTLGGSKCELEGGFKYVTINLLSSAFFLAGAGLLYSKVGTLNMADLALRLSNAENVEFVRSTAVLFLVAFGVKAALFPLFFWLPAAYHTPPTAVSALFAGLLTKVGVYALMRSYTLFFAESFEATQSLLLWIAALTMVTGVLGAAAQYHLRKILSFHIISQIGYMLMGLALMTPLALAGTVFYLVHHIIVKTNLFLIAGIMRKRCGTEELAAIGGFYRSAPWLALLFFVPAFSLGGIPPLSGFWAKFALVKAGLADGYFWLVGTALLVGIFTLYSMIKIWSEGFLKAHPHPPMPQDFTLKEKAYLYAPVAALTLITLVLSFYAQPLFSIAETAAAQLLNPTGYIEAVLGTTNNMASHEAP